MQPYEDLVVQPQGTQGVGGLGGVEIEGVVVELCSLGVGTGDFICVFLGIHIQIGAVAYVGRGHILVQRIRGIGESAVVLCLDLVDEGERYAEGLVHEESMLLDGVVRIVKSHGKFLCIEGRVPNHGHIRNAAVLALDYLVVHIAAVHHILLAQVGESHHCVSVAHVFALKDTVPTVFVVCKREVQFRENVLGSPHPDIGFFLLVLGKEGTPVGQFGIWGFGVEHREGGG